METTTLADPGITFGTATVIDFADQDWMSVTSAEPNVTVLRGGGAPFGCSPKFVPVIVTLSPGAAVAGERGGVIVGGACAAIR
jgi:hypothetical protein